MKKKPIPATGAHLRSKASRLILRAAFRYLADSERSEVDSVDMPGVRFGLALAFALALELDLCVPTIFPRYAKEQQQMEGRCARISTHDQDYLPARADLPCFST